MHSTDSDGNHAPPFTPEGTIGPFYPGAFVAAMPERIDRVHPLLSHRPQGQPILFRMSFIDSDGKPVRCVIVETWQANAHGRYRHPDDASEAPLDPSFDGFARLRTDEDGFCALATILPGAHAVASGYLRAPHLRLTIFASGIDRIVTQLFFENLPENADDPLLVSLPQPMRERLIATRSPQHDTADAQAYDIRIVMRGEQETPFFDDWQ